MAIFTVAVLIMVSCGFLAVLFCVWGLVCNERAAWARNRLIDHVFESPNWRELNKLYRRTSYDKHVWDLICFRDPWEQYDPRLLEGFER